MKRPPQLWVLSIGILCLSLLPSTLAVRATSLIFAKTTTTTTGAPTEEEAATATSETSVEVNQTITKPPLTGNPQIDYILDPNLPFELKNYNLSDYPFYDRVPEEIDFKCDGLHDGFYASVVHKCQVYHHCLYGTRYDFLCANFTAFDQKTFICHFASEVDCANSKNFWHRNDALYEATTTTAAPTTSQIPFTPSPALNPALRRPSPLSPLSPAGAGGRRRRPFRRRRPQYEYYYDDEEYDADREEYYDDPPIRSSGRRRNKRPRPNRRPEYDEYEQYEDERYDRRTSERRDEERERRPYDRRDDDRRFDDRRPAGSKNKGRGEPEEDDRTKTDERRRPVEDEYERRPYNRPRKPSRDRYDDDKQDDRRFDRPTKPEENKTTRRPFDRNRKTEEDRRYRPKETRPEDDDRRTALKETKLEDDRRYRPSKQEDEVRYRPKEKQDEEDRRYRPKDTKVVADDKDDRRSYNRPRKQEEDNRRYRPKDTKDDTARTTEESKVLIRSNSGSSVYDRPRAPPIIRRPVPKTEREKYDYKPTATAAVKTPVAKVEEEEYYDEYEDDPKPLPPKPTRKPVMDSRESEERRTYLRPRRPFPTRRPVEEPENERRPATIKRPSDRSKEQEKSQEKSREIIRTRIEPEKTAQKPSIEEEEYIDEYEEDKSGSSSKKDDSSNEQIRSRQPATKIETSRETTSKEREHRPEPIVKVVKRPFLPSRGGNPYSARGLQPVGNKALDLSSDNPKEDESDVSKPQDIVKPNKFFGRPNNHELESSKQSSQEDISRSKSAEKDVVYYDEEEELKPVTSRPKGDFRQNLNLPRTTQKPKVPDNYRNPLDINENEYDVTLNDALNPTLPNLPIRSSPTGFSNGRDEYQTYQRPRQITVESASILSPASSDYTYQVKQPQSTQVQSLRYNPYVTVQQLNYRQQPISGQYYATYQ